jgi:anti-sigma factor RsiW
MTDPITEPDLLGYVDDQLDITRRMEVEDYLAKHPQAAAQVMADLGARDALRLALAAKPPRPPMQTLEAAHRLERVLTWREVGLRLQRVAAIALLVGAGWVAHALGGLEITDGEASPKPPAFVGDALHAHQTALLRARMASQLETTHYDPAEIAREAGIHLPSLPGEWEVLDAQVFPSRDGHSVEVEVTTRDLGRISLFAAQVATLDVIMPTVARFDQTRTFYWQSGQLAYALTGDAPESTLERAAMRLAGKLQ